MAIKKTNLFDGGNRHSVRGSRKALQKQRSNSSQHQDIRDPEDSFEEPQKQFEKLEAMVKINTIELRTFGLLAALFLLSGSHAFRYVVELVVFDNILGGRMSMILNLFVSLHSISDDLVSKFGFLLIIALFRS